MKAFYRSIFFVLATLAIVPLFVHAAPTLSETLEAVKNKYTFNDQINAAVTDGDTLYLGGSFTQVSQSIGEAGLFDLTGGDFADFPKVETLLDGGETVYTSISDGQGGWFLGGSFDTVDGDAHYSVLHVFPDGTIDTDFDPVFVPDSDIVYTLALSSDGSVLYAGGAFATVNGTVRHNLAAINIADGTLVSSFDPNVSDAEVRALELSSDDSILYAGGAFTCVNGTYGDLDGCLGTTRNRLAAFDTSDGTVTDFDPDANATVYALQLSSDDTTLYAAGNFAVVNGATGRGYVAGFDTSDGNATSFDPELNNGATTLALSPDDSTLYVGGEFTCVEYDSGLETCNADRNYLAGLDTTQTTDVATAFNPNPSSAPNALAVSEDGLTVYAGGNFTSVNGVTSRKRLAALDATTGTATAEDFAGGTTGQVYTLALDGTDLFFGGEEMSIHTVTRNEVAAIDLATYELTDFNPNVISIDQSVHALALSPDASILYIGGVFNGINGLGGNRSSLAAVTTVDGIMTGFDPDMPAASTVYSLAVSSDGTTVYAGGDFIDWGASEVDYVAKMDATTGAQDPAFFPGLNSTVYTLRLSPDENSLYVGGDFAERVAALDVDDGSVLLQTELPANDSVMASALSSDGLTLYIGGNFTGFSNSTDIGEGAPFSTTSSLVNEAFPLIATGGGGGGGATIYASLPDGNGGWYVGGSFTDVGATEQAALAHILSDGTLDTDFLPVFDQLTTNQVYTLALDGTTLYVGGEFTEINGTTRNNLAALDTTDGSLIAGFDPDVDGYVSDIVLSSDGSVLYAGGGFLEVNSGSTPVAVGYLAGFTTADGVVTAFDAGIDGGVLTLDLSSDDEILYVGGTFNEVNGGTIRNRLAAFTTADSVATAFDPDVNDSVYSIVLSDDEERLFVGGLFDTVNGDNADTPYLAVFDITNGLVTEFNPNIDPPSSPMTPDGFVNDISLSSDGGTLYLVGGFTSLYGETRNNVGAISISGGGSLAAFDPHLTTGETFIREIEFSDDGGIFIGGEPINVVDSVTRDHIAALDTSDFSFTDFDPAPVSAVQSLALSSDDDLLYAGGSTFLYVYDTTTGNEGGFSPSVDGNVITLALSPTGDELYAGGDFTNKYAIYSEDISGGGGDDGDDDGGDGDNDDNGGSHGGGSSHRRPQDGINIFVVLMNRIRELLLQLIAQGGTVPPEMMKYLTPITDTTSYTRDLDLNSEGPDVTKLQTFLIQQNKGPQALALGLVGATGFFGPLTQSALAEYQASVGITPATGYFGPITRAYLISIGAW